MPRRYNSIKKQHLSLRAIRENNKQLYAKLVVYLAANQGTPQKSQKSARLLCHAFMCLLSTFIAERAAPTTIVMLNQT